MKYQPTIGLEIHAELKTHSKMFCSCFNDPDEKEPNTNVCPVCMGHPGTLPVINKEAVKKVIKTGIALNCRIPEHSKFDRKSYFYPDLPKSYQISQYDEPLCENGYLEIQSYGKTLGDKVEGQGTEIKKIGITRIHLEEDTGKLIHLKGEDCSLVDFNRAGVPLMELVTEPDIKSADEARRFAESLRLIFRYLNVSEADMEKGQMRCEVNISLAKNGESKTKNKLGTKVEIKNLNSFRAVEEAVKYETKRQTEVLENKEKVIQETRGWDDNKKITVSQRKKEDAHDYRYFPEPDLPPLHLAKANYINIIKAEIPELPQARWERFKEEYSLPEGEIKIFVQNKVLGEYFEKVMSELRNWVEEAENKRRVEEKDFFKLAKFCANYIITDLQGLLKKGSVCSQDFLITPENFAEFVLLIYKGEISSRIAKTTLAEMFKTGADPSHIIQEKDLAQLTDGAEIEKIVIEVIKKNQKAVDDFKKGKINALQFLVGQVMAASRGKASPDTVKNILQKICS